MAAIPENTLIHGDCLSVMQDLPRASLDLIYVDPPFGTGKTRKGRALPLTSGGRACAGENWEEYQYGDGWVSLEEYLAWLKPRLAGMRDLLKPTGSLIVHLDGHASHYVKVMLDELMGRQRFINEIIWHYKTGGRARKRLARKYDSLLWYARGRTFTFNPEAAALPRNQCGLCHAIKPRVNHMRRSTDAEGHAVVTIKSGGRLYHYREDAPGPPCDVWLDISHLHQRDPERTGYPTQKPLKLLERVVGLFSRPDDRVADFFAGSGTTLLAAARLGRKWLGCDRSEEALAIAVQRLEPWTQREASQ